MTDNYDFGKHKDDALTKPRDLCWDKWFKFEKIGDSVQGFIRDVFFRPASGVFGDQRGLTLEKPNKELINVGIKHIDFVLAKTDGLRLGDPVTITFEREIPNKDTTLNPTKQMAFYGKNLEENAEEKTVLQLENEDRKTRDEADTAANQEFDKIPGKDDETTPPSVDTQTTPPATEEKPENKEIPKA